LEDVEVVQQPVINLAAQPTVAIHADIVRFQPAKDVRRYDVLI
jgi:hypothetical protein